MNMKKGITYFALSLCLGSIALSDTTQLIVALFEDNKVKQFDVEKTASDLLIEKAQSTDIGVSTLRNLRREKKGKRHLQRIGERPKWVESSPNHKFIVSVCEDSHGDRTIVKVLSARSKQVIKEVTVGEHIEDFLWFPDSGSITFLEHDCRISKRHFFRRAIGHPKFKCAFYISIVDLNSGQIHRKQVGKEMTDAQGIILNKK